MESPLGKMDITQPLGGRGKANQDHGRGIRIEGDKDLWLRGGGNEEKQNPHKGKGRQGLPVSNAEILKRKENGGGVKDTKPNAGSRGLSSLEK